MWGYAVSLLNTFDRKVNLHHTKLIPENDYIYGTCINVNHEINFKESYLKSLAVSNLR